MSIMFPIFTLLVTQQSATTDLDSKSREETKSFSQYIEIAQRHVGFALPDPRNRDFHRATIKISHPDTGSAKHISICGWISRDKSTIIAPNAYIYQVIKDEGKISPKSWIETATTSDSMSLRILSSTHPAQTINPLTPAFFAVRGETELANQSYQKHILKALGPRYFVLSIRFILHEQAATHIVQKDDTKAISRLEDLQRLVKLERRYLRFTSEPQPSNQQPISLDDTRVLDDLKRRTTSKKYNEGKRHSKQVTKSERLRQLVQDLENVSATSYILPNHFKWESEPIPAKLISMGSDAIPQLIDCLEKDHRLSRTTTISRSVDEHFIIPVSTIAGYCLDKIKQQPKNSKDSDPNLN